MKLLILGTFIRDKIVALNGEVTFSLGGISHTLSAIMAEARDEDSLLPVCLAGEDIKDQVQVFLKADRHIDSRGIHYIPQRNNMVELKYIDEKERVERSLYPLPEIDIEIIKPFYDADALIINMISGWEISLQTLKQIRRNFNKPILMDFHSLSLGRNEDGTRFYRQVQNFPEWIRCCDVVQMNALEFENLGGDLQKPENILLQPRMPSALILQITLAEEGSLTIIRNNHYLHAFRAKWVDDFQVLDPTGCGDAFLGAFAIHYLRTNDPEQAARKANLIAGIAGSVRGLADPQFIKEKKQALWN